MFKLTNCRMWILKCRLCLQFSEFSRKGFNEISLMFSVLLASWCHSEGAGFEFQAIGSLITFICLEIESCSQFQWHYVSSLKPFFVQTEVAWTSYDYAASQYDDHFGLHSGHGFNLSPIFMKSEVRMVTSYSNSLHICNSVRIEPVH